MATVNDLIGAKTDASRYAVKATETVYRAIRLMANRRIGAVLFTERDYIMRVEVEGRAAKETLLREVMTDKMYTVRTSTSIEHCLALMTLYRFRHLPVVEEGMLMGIISMRDAVAAVLEAHGAEMQGLENYTPASGFHG
jgi:CBS domain-containing protein